MQNQAPKQRARNPIDDQLRASGWVVQGMAELSPAAACGVAVREYPTDMGPMDYLLLVDGQPGGLLQANLPPRVFYV